MKINTMIKRKELTKEEIDKEVQKALNNPNVMTKTYRKIFQRELSKHYRIDEACDLIIKSEEEAIRNFTENLLKKLSKVSK